jgi:protein involved in polysaccharide export with SLBB domain
LPSAFVPGFRLHRQDGNAGNIGLDLMDAMRHPGGPNDIILRPGDRVTVPTIPLSVRVEGAVGFPTSVVFEQGKGIGHYIANAGGFTEDAKQSHARVVYPNGTSKQVRRWWWDPEVKPGSIVQVPRKQPGEGVDWGEVVVRSTQVIASLATIVFIIDQLDE